MTRRKGVEEMNILVLAKYREAYGNYLAELISGASECMRCREIHYKRHAACERAEDERETRLPAMFRFKTPEEYLQRIAWLFHEIENMDVAIRDAKRELFLTQEDIHIGLGSWTGNFLFEWIASQAASREYYRTGEACRTDRDGWQIVYNYTIKVTEEPRVQKEWLTELFQRRWRKRREECWRAERKVCYDYKRWEIPVFPEYTISSVSSGERWVISAANIVVR